jgi:surface protein
MFSRCYSFNQPLNDWNVSNVTNMGAMFNGCKKFNQPLNRWHIQVNVNITLMFNNSGMSHENMPQHQDATAPLTRDKSPGENMQSRCSISGGKKIKKSKRTKKSKKQKTKIKKNKKNQKLKKSKKNKKT